MLATLRQYFQVQSALSPSFSPDGETVSFIMNTSGVPQLWSLPVGGGWPTQLTFFEDRVAEQTFSPVAPCIVFTMDQGGNERHQLYVVEADGGGWRALTDCPGAIHSVGRWSGDGRWLAWAANREHPAHFCVYLQEAASGRVRLLWPAEGMHQVLGWTPDDQELVIARINSNCDHDLFLLSLADGTLDHLTPHEGEAQYGQVAWRQDGSGFYLITSQDRELAYVAFYQTDQGALTPVFCPDGEVELLRWSPGGERLAVSVNEEGYSRLLMVDPQTGSAHPVPGLPPAAVITGLEWSPDGERLVMAVDGSCHNPNLWVYTVAGGGLRQLTLAPRGGVERNSLVEPELIRFPSFDGLSIPAFYYRPPAATPPYPVVIDIHGGPESQRRLNFNPLTQYLVQAGYAVLAPNVRGSTGYGKHYAHLDDVYRRMDAVKDIASAVQWLTQEGDADPRRLAVMGGSYGGFMVLACITEYPELFAGAIDTVGIANFVTFLERTGPWRRHLREAEYGSLEHDRDFLVSISPLHKADRIRTPLLVIHGANDPRVPVQEAEQIVSAIRERGGEVEYLRYEDEGHGLVKLKNRLHAYARAAEFLQRFVQGKS